MIFRHGAKKLLDFLFSDCFPSLRNLLTKSASELKVGRRQFHIGVNGFILFIFYNITLSQRFAPDGLRFFFFFYCVTLFAIRCSTRLSTRRTLPAHSKMITGHYSALESVSNRLKNVVTHFQCIFQHTFNAFSTYLFMPGIRQ